MSKKKKILFAAFEAAPFVKTGGLGDVAGSLPSYIKSDEYDIRVILPKLSAIPPKYHSEMKYICNYKVPLGWREQYCGLFELEHRGVTYYFLDNEYYFYRERVYGDFDDGERVAFFSKAVLESISRMDFKPDIIHCNDWHTALTPVFLHEHYNGLDDYRGIKTVLTIHNLRFQGMYDRFIIGDILGLRGTNAEPQLIHDNSVNYLKGGIIYSDMVTTVSPTYAENICTHEYGEGLESLFCSIRYKLRGIINGIDYNVYDPSKDEYITEHYDITSMDHKAVNKAALQNELGLKEDKDIPLFVIVSRLTPQKGMDVVSYLLPQFADKKMQLAILGTGYRNYEDAFRHMSGACPDRIAARIEFDEGLSRRFYAGADVLIMPSVFEPCGLSQMMAMRYGTLPLVRETGGLKDTVDGYWETGDRATGFLFKDADTNALNVTVDLAIKIWNEDKKLWKRMQENAMKKDFSWHKSAIEYRKMYDELIG